MNANYTIKEINDLHHIFQGFRSYSGFGFWFRGQANHKWGLLPKAGRPNFYLPKNRDLGRFHAWTDKAIAYTSLPDSEIEALALAQHYGLATRLLDWTMNPLVATYFACESEPSIDGAVYILEPPNDLATPQTSIDIISQLDGIYGYIPKAISPRVINQKGLFTLHCDAMQKINLQKSTRFEDHSNLQKIIIPSKLKSKISTHIEDYGIDKSFLFPDIDGLSAHINQLTLSMKRN
ncbi:FRG domain-containing protein [Chromobacterium vaccinii]|nr:FRG domain-containing protein [Chromobacterium vaccinii]